MGRYILFAFMLLSYKGIPAQNLLTVTGQAIVNQTGDTVLLRGLGLGGWMLQEGYMMQSASFANAQYQLRNKIEELIGPKKTDQFYEAWLDNFVTRQDIDSLKSWGFNCIRLPMHYNLFTLPIEDEPVMGEDTWLEKGFALTDSLLNWCTQNEMYLILDLHAAPGGQGMDQGISDYDPIKPSLWESADNQRKTVALWQKIAARYQHSDWIAGYDLINEPNWDLPDNRLLASLYKEITTSIREVDDRHILFIEGNWFANDFTGLTPPWDPLIVYSPHKYWSFNDPSSIQWVLDLQEAYDVPLFIGESGENSNVWFRNAIRLFEDHSIGWAWWPLKKVQSIAGPLSIELTSGYQKLLDYWHDGEVKMDSNEAFQILMDLTEKVKIEHCRFQKDVIDAMFRQVYADETSPFVKISLPGTVYATQYDLGRQDYAYHDVDVANYQVSSGQYTAWNKGWSYRNDGVDIEPCSDNIRTNGYNIGWMEKGEWMKYSFDSTGSALYDVEIRYASNVDQNRFQLLINDEILSEIIEIDATGGWQNWATIKIEDLILDTEDLSFKFVVEGGEFNLSSFHFVQKGLPDDIPTDFQDANTATDQSIRLTFNKRIIDTSNDIVGLSLGKNNIPINISAIAYDSTMPRSLLLYTEEPYIFSDQLTISYSGLTILGNDSTKLRHFQNRPVRNTLPIIHQIPGRIEAEQFASNFGIKVEQSSDNVNARHIGFLDAGDYAEYKIYVRDTDDYELNIQVASEEPGGRARLVTIDSIGNREVISSFQLSTATGGWQNWSTISKNVRLDQGNYTLRLEIMQGPFNIDWFAWKGLSTEEPSIPKGVSIWPNPVVSALYFQAGFQIPHDVHVYIYSIDGKLYLEKGFNYGNLFREEIDLSPLTPGSYFFVIRLEDDSEFIHRFVKID